MRKTKTTAAKFAKTIKAAADIPEERLRVFVRIFELCKELGINPFEKAAKRKMRRRVSK